MKVASTYASSPAKNEIIFIFCFQLFDERAPFKADVQHHLCGLLLCSKLVLDASAGRQALFCLVKFQVRKS
jgi:hypothetical protein